MSLSVPLLKRVLKKAETYQNSLTIFSGKMTCMKSAASLRAFACKNLYIQPKLFSLRVYLLSVKGSGHGVHNISSFRTYRLGRGTVLKVHRDSEKQRAVVLCFLVSKGLLVPSALSRARGTHLMIIWKKKTCCFPHHHTCVWICDIWILNLNIY